MNSSSKVSSNITKVYSSHLAVMMHGHFGQKYYVAGDKMNCKFPYLDENEKDKSASKSRSSCTKLVGVCIHIINYSITIKCNQKRNTYISTHTYTNTHTHTHTYTYIYILFIQKGNVEFCKVLIKNKGEDVEPVWINCTADEITVKYSETTDFINQVCYYIIIR